MTLAIACAWLGSACGSSQPAETDAGAVSPSTAADAAPGVASDAAPQASDPAGRATLTVERVQSAYGIAGIEAERDYFLVVLFALANHGFDAPLPAASVLFSVELAGGAVLAASPHALRLPGNPCAADLSVAPGGQVSCAVAFDVPAAVPATHLIYVLPEGGMLRAPLPENGAPAGPADDRLVGGLTPAELAAFCASVAYPAPHVATCTVMGGSAELVFPADGAALCGAGTLPVVLRSAQLPSGTCLAFEAAPGCTVAAYRTCVAEMAAQPCQLLSERDCAGCVEVDSNGIPQWHGVQCPDGP
jgi:hypothetical protein